MGVLQLFPLLILSSFPYISSGFDSRHPHLIKHPTRKQEPNGDSFPLWDPLGDANSTSHAHSHEPTKIESPSSNLPEVGNLFLGQNGTVIRAQVGGTAVLNCWVQLPPTQLEYEGGPLMWSRDNPFALLALGGTIHILDPRFWTQHPKVRPSSDLIHEGTRDKRALAKAKPSNDRMARSSDERSFPRDAIEVDPNVSGSLQPIWTRSRQNAWNWPLVIRGLQLSDNGTYKCQTSSDPPSFLFTQLIVIEAKATIQGPKERYLRLGSTLHLDCVFHNITAQPNIIFWYRDNRMIAYDPDVRIRTDPILNRTQLTIENVSYAHSGNYTCMPSPLVPDSAVVQVITDEDKAPAAVYINHAPRALFSTWNPTLSLIVWLAKLHLERIMLAIYEMSI